MRVSPATVGLLAALSLDAPSFSLGFHVSPSAGGRVAARNTRGNVSGHQRLRLGALFSTTTEDNETTSATTVTKKKKKKLGLLTFDLDDTLYPIAPVLDEANTAFSTAMSNFGYVGIQPSDIVAAGKQIRQDIAEGARVADSDDNKAEDPLKPTTVNHKEIRLAAIRKKMEEYILKTKLTQTAADWATDVDDLTAPVIKSAEKWARTTVHSSVVQAVYNAWEMERHHAAERHLFPDAISAIKQIQSDNPNVIIGAVTDGSANPMLMVFSLMPLFDFTVSWEDDIANVQQMEQFQELSAVDKSDELSWIYRLAVQKGKEMSALTSEIKKKNDSEEDDDIEWCWVHVGDDLAYDVGGAATCGAKTVLVDLASEYGQTARLRLEGKAPEWSTESEDELNAHRKMSTNAMDKVDAKIQTLSQLPEVINELLN